MKCLDEAGKVSSRLFIPPPQLICAAAPMFTLTLLLAAAILIYIDTDPCLSVYTRYIGTCYMLYFLHISKLLHASPASPTTVTHTSYTVAYMCFMRCL